MKKGQNGRKSLRRLKPTVGRNASGRRRRVEKYRKFRSNTVCLFLVMYKVCQIPEQLRRYLIGNL